MGDVVIHKAHAGRDVHRVRACALHCIAGCATHVRVCVCCRYDSRTRTIISGSDDSTVKLWKEVRSVARPSAVSALRGVVVVVQRKRGRIATQPHMIPLGTSGGVRATRLRVGVRVDLDAAAPGAGETVCLVGGSDGGLRCMYLAKGKMAWQVRRCAQRWRSD